jgi:predicted GNAT family acetyltransferase
MSIDVRDNPGESRYEILVDGSVAGFTTYTLQSDRIALIHTEVGEEYTGRGLGARLVAEELDDMRGRGLHVLPFCPLVRQFIEDNPTYLDLVPAKDRARFHLPAVESEGQG